MLTKAEKKYLSKVCDAKAVVCNACSFHNKNVCDQCPISNLVDKELMRLKTKTINNDRLDDILDVR